MPDKTSTAIIDDEWMECVYPISFLQPLTTSESEISVNSHNLFKV